MNKKISIIIIFVGIIIIIISLFFLFSNRGLFFEIKLTDELKNEINERIDVMTSDYHCNQRADNKEKSNCIYFVESLDNTQYEESDRIYYLVLSNMDKSEQIKYEEDMEFTEESEVIIQDDYLATHSIPSKIIKEKYEQIYGEYSSETLSAANELKRNPRVKYSTKDDMFYVSYMEDGEKITSTLSEDLNYEINGNKIIVYRAVVYLSEKSNEGYYSLYSDPKLTNKLIEKISESELQTYKIEIENSTIYKFEFKYTIDEKYEFNSLNIVKNYK